MMQFNIVISETLLIPILICQLLFLAINGLHISYNVGFNTECVDGKLAFLQIIQIALDQCVFECARRKKCRGISYRKRFTMCNLIDVDNPPYLSSTPADCVLVSKNDMKYQLPQTCKDCENCDLDAKQCLITECPKLTINDGALLGNMNSIGNRVKYTCNPGFKRETMEAYATCKADGTWSIVPRCVEVECPKPTLNDGTLSDNTSNIGSRVKYTCNPGFKSETAEGFATCQADGTWTIVPRCVVDSCYNTPCMNGGICTATTTDQYTCTCMYGFTGPNCEIAAIIVCEGGEMKLWCPDGKVIDIKSANYGRTQDRRVCPHTSIKSTNCLLQSSFHIVSTRCSGQPSCLLDVKSATFGIDPCVGTYKYLEVDYSCK